MTYTKARYRLTKSKATVGSHWQKVTSTKGSSSRTKSMAKAQWFTVMAIAMKASGKKINQMDRAKNLSNAATSTKAALLKEK